MLYDGGAPIYTSSLGAFRSFTALDATPGEGLIYLFGLLCAACRPPLLADGFECAIC